MCVRHANTSGKSCGKNEKGKYLSIFLSRLHTSEENDDNMSRSARQSASWWCFSFTHCMLFTAKSPTYSLRKKSLYKSKEKMQQKNIFELLRYTKWAQTINMVESSFKNCIEVAHYVLTVWSHFFLQGLENSFALSLLVDE